MALDVAKKEILIVGLGKSGVSAANLLGAHGAVITITDSKNATELQEQIGQLRSPAKLSLGGHKEKDFRQTDMIIVSPGVPSELPELDRARACGIPILSEIELAYRFLKGSFIGITGSNGKTTTTSLVGKILEASTLTNVVAGNIGNPLTEIAQKPVQGDRIHIVELSSFQLETIIDLRCQIAVLLNITPDHLDRYESFSAYQSAKARIFLNQTKEDYAVFNADDPATIQLLPSIKAKPFPFSRHESFENGSYVKNHQICISREGHETKVLPIDRLKLKGSHNLENVLAAVSAGFLAGAPADAIKEAVTSFEGLEHRLEFVARRQGIDFYNDSKATNVDSAIRALEAFDQPVIAILGGLDKGTDFTPLREVAPSRIKRLLLYGAAAEKIFSVIGSLVPTSRAEDLEEAVAEALQTGSAGDVVVLAPACASFDMFENYEHRGRVFKQLVNALN